MKGIFHLLLIALILALFMLLATAVVNFGTTLERGITSITVTAPEEK